MTRGLKKPIKLGKKKQLQFMQFFKQLKNDYSKDYQKLINLSSIKIREKKIDSNKYEKIIDNKNSERRSDHLDSGK